MKKIKIYNEFLKEDVDWKDADSDYSDYDDEYEPEDDSDDDNDMENYLYLIRGMFKNAGFAPVVTNKGLDIAIEVPIGGSTKINNLIKIFEIVKKLRKDILAEYDSEFDIWTKRTGNAIIIFNFYYDGADGDDNMPF